MEGLTKSKRVAIYARVSTDEQAEKGNGLDVQKERLRKYCESQAYSLDDQNVYVDEGYSGSLAIDKRPELTRLFDDARAKKFEVVIVYRLDRFFRSTRKLLDAIEDLSEMKIEFKSATEPFDTGTANGKFVVQMLGAIAELERETIKERMSGGRERSARDGKWVTGVPPYGYQVDKKTKKLSIVPDEAAVVRQFFEWLVYEKCSLHEITKRANEKNLPAPKHKTFKKRKTLNYWWKRTINRILVNEVYTGEFYYRKYKRPFVCLNSVTDEKHQRDKSEWIKLDVPAIISVDLFQASLRQLKKNRDDSVRNTKRPYLYTKLLYCGETGLKLQSSYKAPRFHKDSPHFGKGYHTYVPERAN